MKKLNAILKGRKFIDKLFSLREREIKREIETARDEFESKKAKAEMEYERLLHSLGDENINYKTVFNQMLTQKEIISDANNSLGAIKEIEEDLNSEVQEECSITSGTK